MSLFTNIMTVDPVVKRLMLTAVSYSIAEIREHAMLKGMLSLKKSLQISNSDDFKVGIICGEAFARAAVMLRMYMGREPTREESELMIALLIQRSNDIRDSLYKSP